MSKTQNCVCWHRKYRHVLVSFLFLLVSTLTHNTISMVEGRAISKVIEASQKGEAPVDQDEEEKMVMRAVVRARKIGSRPPRCERRCSGCGHCEAVQVPVVPATAQLKLIQRQNHSTSIRSNTTFFSLSAWKQLACSSSANTRTSCNNNNKVINDNDIVVAYNSRGEDLSNYKPMSWKCKCGDFLFNP